jgi:hypothetical protein
MLTIRGAEEPEHPSLGINNYKHSSKMVWRWDVPKSEVHVNVFSMVEVRGVHGFTFRRVDEFGFHTYGASLGSFGGGIFRKTG